MNVIITDKWNTYLDQFEGSQKDVYYLEEYVKLYENDRSKALCIVCSEGGSVLLMPFIRGEIEDYYDFETQYGYGGPITNTSDKNWIDKALSGIKDYFRDNRYICGFIRFHPLIDNAAFCKDTMNVIYDRHTVAILTDKGVEDIWTTQISSKNRNMIRKAEKSGLIYKAEDNLESFPEFIDLYNATMKRIGADEFYYFDDDYYKEFKNGLIDNSFLATVRLDGKLICSAIIMYDGDFGHYHLEGSDHEYKSLGANNLLLWKSACRLHELGVKKFHLGGGNSTSEEDPLFKFKKAFTHNLESFAIGKEIYNKDVYDRICQKWERENSDKIASFGNRLLKYRY